MSPASFRAKGRGFTHGHGCPRLDNSRGSDADWSAPSLLISALQVTSLSGLPLLPVLPPDRLRDPELWPVNRGSLGSAGDRTASTGWAPAASALSTSRPWQSETPKSLLTGACVSASGKRAFIPNKLGLLPVLLVHPRSDSAGLDEANQDSIYRCLSTYYVLGIYKFFPHAQPHLMSMS